MWQPSKLTPEQIEERRMEGGRLLREGNLSHAEIARRLGVSRSAVSQWARQIKQRRRGLQGLESIKHKGRQSYLTDSQWQKVLRDMQRGAQAFGYEDERWTLSRIQRLIADRYGVGYNTNYLSEKLRKSGWSVQQPVRVAREREEALVTGVAPGTLAPDQKKARRRRALIVFVDETGFSFQSRPARTWAPRRRPPVLRRKSQRRQISTIAALAINGRIYKRHYREAIRGPQVVRMLRHLRRLPRAAIDSDMGPISGPSRACRQRVSGDGTEDQCRVAAALCAGTESGRVLPRQCQRANPEHDAGIGGRDATAS